MDPSRVDTLMHVSLLNQGLCVTREGLDTLPLSLLNGGLSLDVSTDAFIYRCIHLPMHSSTDAFIYRCIHLPMRSSIHSSIDASLYDGHVDKTQVDGTGRYAGGSPGKRPPRVPVPEAQAPCRAPCSPHPCRRRVCVYVYVCVSVSEYVYVCLCLCVCVCVRVYVYAYIYVYIYMYI